jgi:hypothetical protein
VALTFARRSAAGVAVDDIEIADIPEEITFLGLFLNNGIVPDLFRGTEIAALE